jgi:glyoxylase-like metal-dependent hydrolase (beta-lactamase superfamily II)
VEEDGLLLTGDHIMQGSTVVIIPPHGDMKAYIESLQLLLNYPLKALAPAHGHIIDDPVAEIEGLIAHRLGREAKVRQVLERERQASLEALTPLVYDDVDASLYPIAQLSLWAHLLKLEKERVVELAQERWRFL